MGETTTKGAYEASHDDNCLNLLYGWFEVTGTFHPPVATPENAWQPHVAYHTALLCGCEDGTCADCHAVWQTLPPRSEGCRR